MYTDSFFKSHQSLNCRGKLLSLEKPLVMGILNITPDSFYDGGRNYTHHQSLVHARQMLQEGADIIDIGAMSTRPGAAIISEEEEKSRLLPVLESLREEFPDAVLSVDTFRATIARMSVDAGADIINDVSGGMQDPQMFKTIADLKVPYILMHMQGSPADMQKNPQYHNVVKDIGVFFTRQLEELRAYGVHDIILDPGFGFGKTLQHNYQLLKGLPFFQMFELPLLVGVSRKSMVTKLLDLSPENALNGTTALHVLALERGANILRVHDVQHAKQVVRIIEQVNRV
ncbi:MAG: dihydropteroate synthase [Bacteroidales bacterium]